jgi:hypothetical protein
MSCTEVYSPPTTTVSYNVHKSKIISSFLQILNVSGIFDRKTLRITYYKYATTLNVIFFLELQINFIAMLFNVIYKSFKHFLFCYYVKQCHIPVSYQSTESGHSEVCLPSPMSTEWCQLFLVRLPGLSYLSENKQRKL